MSPSGKVEKGGFLGAHWSVSLADLVSSRPMRDTDSKTVGESTVTLKADHTVRAAQYPLSWASCTGYRQPHPQRHLPGLGLGFITAYLQEEAADLTTFLPLIVH